MYVNNILCQQRRTFAEAPEPALKAQRDNLIRKEAPAPQLDGGWPPKVLAETPGPSPHLFFADGAPGGGEPHLLRQRLVLNDLCRFGATPATVRGDARRGGLPLLLRLMSENAISDQDGREKRDDTQHASLISRSVHGDGLRRSWRARITLLTLNRCVWCEVGARSGRGTKNLECSHAISTKEHALETRAVASHGVRAREVGCKLFTYAHGGRDGIKSPDPSDWYRLCATA